MSVKWTLRANKQEIYTRSGNVLEKRRFENEELYKDTKKCIKKQLQL